MAKSHFLQNSFVSGELSPIVKGRTDLDQYYQGLEIAENVVTVPQGGVKRRPGFEAITIPIDTGFRRATTPTMPNGGTGSAINDGSPLTFTTTTTNVGTISNYIIAEYDLGSQQSVGFIDVIGIKSTTSAEFTNLRIEWSANGSSWVELPSFYKVMPYKQDLRIEYPESVDPRYVRLKLDGANNAGTARIQLSEFNLRAKDGAPNEDAFQIHAFEIGVDESYLLLFTIQNCRIYRIDETSTTFIQDLYTGNAIGFGTPKSVAVNENVALLFNRTSPVGRIVFNGEQGPAGPAPFQIDAPTFLNIPQYDFNDSLSPTPSDEVQVLTLTHGSGHNWEIGDRFQFDIEGVLSKNVTFAGDSTADEQSSTVANIQRNLQEMPIFGDTGVAVARTGTRQYTITISGESTKDFELFAGFATLGDGDNTLVFTKTSTGSPRSEDLWSFNRGYPASGLFTGGRLWLGGTKSKPQSILASKAGSFLDFLVKEGADDEGIFVTINGKNSEIISISGDRGVQVFTQGAEYQVEGNTPSDISIVEQTQYGTRKTGANAIVSLDGATMFLDRNGRSLRQYLYNFNEDAYRSIDMSVLASHLINDPKDIAVATSTTSEDASYVFIVNADGTGVLLNTLREQDIIGFTKVTQYAPDGDLIRFYRCATVNNRIITISRIAQYVFSVDVMNETNLLDHGRTVSPPFSMAYSGFDALAGEKVQLVFGSTILPERFVTVAGQVFLSSSEQQLTGANLHIGFNFIPKIKPMPINSRAANSSQNVLRQKRINRMNMRVYESGGISIDGSLVGIRSFGDANNSPLNPATLAPVTGIIEDNNGGNGWDREVAPVITQTLPAPLHIQAISYEVSSS